ncbi:MAG TPA: hypothetical protein PLB55_00335 [Prosthecobacter sp.]|nr:hypothetical protein [Prosthecobacter sp.]
MRTIFIGVLFGFTILTNRAFAGEPTFYQRADGTMTVVETTKNFFGATEQRVRRYSSPEQAYKAEYPAKHAAAAAIMFLAEAGYNWYKQSQTMSPPATDESLPRKIVLHPSSDAEKFIEIESILNESQKISKFGSIQSFEKLVTDERKNSLIEKRAYAQNGKQIQQLGISGEDYFILTYEPSLQKKIMTLVMLVQSSENDKIQRGDIIFGCDGKALSPEYDLTALLNSSTASSVSHKIALGRPSNITGEDKQAPSFNALMIDDVTSKSYSPTESVIQKVRWTDSQRTVVARMLAETYNNYEPMWTMTPAR